MAPRSLNYLCAEVSKDTTPVLDNRMMNMSNYENIFEKSKSPRERVNRITMIKSIDFSWSRKKKGSNQDMDVVKLEFSKDSSIVRQVT
jgi:hypothetical protein